MIILFKKSQAALFESPIQVAGSVRKDGTIVAPHIRLQKIAHKPHAAEHASMSLFGDDGAPTPEAAQPEPAPTTEPTKAPAKPSRLKRLAERVTRFASGLSRAKDFEAAGHGGHPVGVDVGQLSDQAMDSLADMIVRRGAEVFVDSGAYSLFRAREKKAAAGDAVEPLDFQQVLDRYDRLTELIQEKNEAEESLPKPILVMPDVMGDQAASLNELKKHAKWINVEASFNVSRPLVPMPKGEMSLPDYYDAAVAAIGTDRFIVGIPAVSQAWSPAEVSAFLAARKPARVHFLGALHEKRLNPWLQAVVDAGVDGDVEVTADANPLRSMILPRDGTKLGPGERQEKITEKLGKPARLRELGNVIASYGGPDGVKKMLAGADFEQQQRFIGLVSDLSGKPQAEVRKEYGLGDGPVEGDEKTEGGVTYQLRNGRWRRVTPDEKAADEAPAAPEPASPDRLVLVACGDKKQDKAAPARELYTGALGSVLNKWLPKGPEAPDVAIISAKHGLVHGDQVIEPYNQRMTPERAKELAAKPADVKPFDGKRYREVFVAGGKEYRQVAEEYVRQLKDAGIVAPDAEVKMTSGGIGEIRGQLGAYLRGDGAAPEAPAVPVEQVDATLEAAADRLLPHDREAPFGVPAGITKGQRRAINAEVAQLVADGKTDKALMSQYSGNGGCGDSLNEFYTDPDVARAMWDTLARLGATSGTALEPSCGTGVFLHTAPAGFRVTGTELEPISAACAAALHGDRHEVMPPASFERFATSDDRQFDVVIGNPPYGPRGYLAKDDKVGLTTAEAYFTDTALDKAKPGGLVALVLPTGIMDSSTNRLLRERLLTKGQFLGAQRMPNTAFEHSHTEVTTDVVYFRKRPDDIAGALGAVDQQGLQQLGVWDDEFIAGNYFTGRGAGNVLGTMTEGWRARAGMGQDITVEGSMQGVAEAISQFTPDPESRGPADISMPDVLAALPDEASRNRAASAAAIRPYANLAKVGDTKTVDGVTYVLQGDPARWHRVDEFMETPAIADARPIAAQIEQLMAGHAIDRPALEAQVRAYVERYGVPAKNADLMTAAGVDKTLFRLIGAVDRKGELSDVVQGRAARQVEGTLDTHAQALALEESGSFTPAELAARLGRDAEEVEDQLIADPRYAYMGGGRWTTMDTYLTGELWPKLDAAKAGAADESNSQAKRERLADQAARLEKTIDPKSLDDVDFQVNSAFIPTHVLEAYFNWRLQDGPTASDWSKKQPPVTIKFADGVYLVEGGNTWSTTKLLDKYLNRTGVRKDDKPELDQWNAEFREWLCASSYRDAVEELYNRNFRGFVARKFSDAPIEVPGLTVDRDVRSWRWSSLRRSLSDGRGIVADDVGLGKTLGGLLLTRMAKVNGTSKKPAFVVPKSVLANWFAESQVWFPGSRVLTVGANFHYNEDGELVGRDDAADERKRKWHDLTQNDYDFILISEPAFEEVDLDPKTKHDYYEDDFWVQRGESLGNAGDKRRKAIKERYEQSLAQREFQDRTDAIYFNDLGIDMLVADEMHHQKNLYAARARFGEQPKFLGGQGLSNRALDFNLKTRWIREQNGGKGVYGLTATPTKNSPLEIYSMLSHIAPEAFERIKVRNSEEFLDRFCEFASDKVLSTSGDIEDALVVTGFKNLTELREIMSRFIDRRTADEVGLKLPTRNDRMHLVDMTPQQQAVYAELRELATESRKKDSTGDSHIFSVMDKMNKAALDLQLLNPAEHGGASSPKYHAIAKNSAEGVKEGAQIIFSEYVDSHERIAAALVDAGIPRKRIGIINAQVAGSAVKRQNIAEALNSGKLDVVIGNATMAEGLNMQVRTTDIHHADVPWEPATLQQRNGRGLRQGNRNEAMRIHTYLSKGSFDGYRYQSVGAKKDWQDLLWNGGDRVDNLAREGAFTRDDMRIMLAADPEAARAEFEKDKAAAQQRHDAGERVKAQSEFVRFSEMSRSYSALKNKDSATAMRLRNRIEASKTSLFNSKHFPAKAALDSLVDVVIEPQSGMALHAGIGVEAKDGDKAVKFVVTGVNMQRGTVTMRRYADTAGARPVTVPVSELAHDTKGFEFNADHEAAEVSARIAESAEATLGELKDWDSLAKLPAAVIEKNKDRLQQHLKEGAKNYKFSFPYGDVAMVNRETGAIEMKESYEHPRAHETHDYLLPSIDNQDKVIEAWLAARRRAEISREHVKVGGSRSKQTKPAFKRRYGGARYDANHMNPFKSLLDKMSGGGTNGYYHMGETSPLVREAKRRLEDEQHHRIRRADSVADVLKHLVPLAKVTNESISYPKKALALAWAKARLLGKLGDKVTEHTEKQDRYGAGKYDLHTAETFGGNDAHGATRTVHGALVAMAKKSGHADLAATMANTAARHGVEPNALETLRTLNDGFGHGPAALRALRGALDRAGLADQRLSESGHVFGAYANGLLNTNNRWSGNWEKPMGQIVDEHIAQADAKKEAA